MLDPTAFIQAVEKKQAEAGQLVTLADTEREAKVQKERMEQIERIVASFEDALEASMRNGIYRLVFSAVNVSPDGIAAVILPDVMHDLHKLEPYYPGGWKKLREFIDQRCLPFKLGGTSYHAPHGSMLSCTYEQLKAARAAKTSEPSPT